MDRAELLAYIASLRKEQSERLTRQGVTSWALWGAMAGLTFFALPAFPKLPATNSTYLLLCVVFTYFYAALVLGTLLFGGSPFRPSRAAD